MKKEIHKLLSIVENKIGYPEVRVLESATGPEVLINHRKVLMFGSYNYLGLADNTNVKNSSINALKTFGVGTGGVRLLTGSMKIHQDLERMIAELTGHESALTIASGFGTNTGIIPAVVNLMGFQKVVFARRAVIFSDEYNHASIVDGCRLSDAKVVIYKHNDILDLEKKIKKYKRWRKLIITDGVFSMDGDICDLKSIVEISEKYDAMTMVDDAHAIGVLGDTGAGTAEYCGVKGKINLNMGTFSKGLGVSGGFISCESELARYLRIACRTYMFSDALAPPIAGAVIGSLTYLKNHLNLIKELEMNSNYFREKINELGFYTFKSRTHIVPILIGSDRATIDSSNKLYSAGIYAPAVRWPAVPKGTGRLRFSLMANHNRSHINKALEIIKSTLNAPK